MPIKKLSFTAIAVGVMALSGAALAQEKTSIQAIEEYREMLQDGNPAELFEAKGEELWKKPRGPKNASLEKCDLGKGPGVVKGPSSNCRATSRTRARCKTWSRAWSPA